MAAMDATDDPDFGAIWQRIIVGDDKSWVAFANGTCVIVMAPAAGDLAAQATALLAEWGPVHVGTPSADFNVITLPDDAGWVVTCHHPDVLTFVAPDEVAVPNELVVGMMGRSRRDDDAAEPRVVHVADRRG